MSCRVTRQAFPTGFQELLRPGIVQALGDPLATAQRGNALFALKAGQDDPDLLLSRVVLTRLALDASDRLVGDVFRCSGSLVHLRSILASMNQKPSVAQTPKSVRLVLTSDKCQQKGQP